MTRTLLAAVLTIFATMATFAHEVTYKGTVKAIEPNPYAASDGVLAELEMTVAPSGRGMTFGITAHTRIWRGETPVSLEEAAIQLGEAVTVTYIDEEAEKGAQEIRLARKLDA